VELVCRLNIDQVSLPFIKQASLLYTRLQLEEWVALCLLHLINSRNQAQAIPLLTRDKALHMDARLLLLMWLVLVLVQQVLNIMETGKLQAGSSLGAGVSPSYSPTSYRKYFS
jgi:hypothetical protein